VPNSCPGYLFLDRLYRLLLKLENPQRFETNPFQAWHWGRHLPRVEFFRPVTAVLRWLIAMFFAQQDSWSCDFSIFERPALIWSNLHGTEDVGGSLCGAPRLSMRSASATRMEITHIGSAVTCDAATVICRLPSAGDRICSSIVMDREHSREK
jgi:hypothetical protein